MLEVRFDNEDEVRHFFNWLVVSGKKLRFVFVPLVNEFIIKYPSYQYSVLEKYWEERLSND